jgi:UrcA family protein
MNINALSIGRVVVVSTLLAFGVTAWSVASATGLASSSMRVQLKDLDLSTPGGRQIANDRLRQAARAVCYRVSDPEDLGRDIHIAACVDRVMAQANITVQQLASRSESIQVAKSPSR